MGKNKFNTGYKHSVGRNELVSAIIAAESFNDLEMSDTLMQLYSSMLSLEERNQQYVDAIAVSSIKYPRIRSYLNRTKASLR